MPNTNENDNRMMHLRNARALVEERLKIEIDEACRAAGLSPLDANVRICSARRAVITQIYDNFLARGLEEMPYRSITTFKNHLNMVFRELGYHRRVR